ncbi:MAG: hypothetical protein DME25_03740 [Verrucomicrobia bacterium]|nr:MAG: hypothetical protein DME25_03740 [Verrucomicrobiota bacterium]
MGDLASGNVATFIMTSRQLKAGYFVLAWLNILAAAYYFNYLFFHLRTEFGFGNRGNLFVAGLNGLLYACAAWFAGKFAQRRGYFTALYVGFGVMTVALGVGSRCHSLMGQCAAMLVWTFGICFTWPTLEALVSEGETRAGLRRMLGIYNVVWAGGAALAYFTGGTLLESLGPGSLYWLPAMLHAAQLGLTRWLHCASRTVSGHSGSALACSPAESSPVPARSKAFLQMAWLANPFAYVAMNTVIPLIPGLAAKLNLSTSLAGFVASVWMFARFFAFIGLWLWTGWHYKVGWLVGAYGSMLLSFAALLLGSNLAVTVVAQLVFGLAVGLIYYSSLYYSMDVGETKGEHGGFHEALIGLGLFGGPAVGAATMQLLPNKPDAGIWTVSVLLTVGLVALLRLRVAG